MGNILHRDCPLTKTLEMIPYVGLLTAIVHQIKGNENHASCAAVKGSITGTTLIIGISTPFGPICAGGAILAISGAVGLLFSPKDFNKDHLYQLVK